MKEPNRKFSTYRLAISVADFAHQNGIQASELNIEYKRIRSFWNLPEFLQSNNKTFKYLVEYTKH